MEFTKIIFVVTVILPFLVGVANGRTRSRTSKLPFTCPFKFDDGIPPNATDEVRRRFSRSAFYEYRAALALVPCDADAQTVYIEEDLDTEYTIAVVYLFDKSLRALQDWVEEKYHAYSYENPIREAVSKTCKDKLSHYSDSYVKSLNGEDLLNILCENDCGFTAPKYGYEKRAKRSDPIYAAPAGYLAPVPQAYSHHPHTNTVHQPSPYQPVVAHPHVNPYPSADHAYQPVKYVAHKEVTFDDAPELIYGYTTRTRRLFHCEGELEEECDRLEAEGKVVQCNIPRFSDCDSEWIDCIVELEIEELKGKFYDQCDIYDGFVGDQELEEVSDVECLENRKCTNGQALDDDNLPFVGHSINDQTCQCSADLGSNDQARAAKRYKREPTKTEAREKNINLGKVVAKAQVKGRRLKMGTARTGRQRGGSNTRRRAKRAAGGGDREFMTQ